MVPGCGKTTLGKKLEQWEPETYKRIVQVTTRPIRDNETDGIDYFFIDNNAFQEREPEMFETVKTQFLPNIYGGESKYLDPEKWNVVVVSIEGFISSVQHSNENDKSVLLNILNDVEPDAKREGRDPSNEERYNLSVLRPLLIEEHQLLLNNKKVDYYEINLSELKEVRNNKEELLECFETICR